MNVSLIVTIFNEERSIQEFLKSIIGQSVKPGEVVLVDGGSTDTTIQLVREFISQNKSNMDFKFFVKKGNRSIGRNEAIRKAKGDIILITDAGCLLDKNWVKEIQKPFTDKSVDVIAGYYKADAKTIFQKCLTPYALVMPDKVNPDDFLPATRSMAIRKKIFQDMGGFDERYSHNEDYVFAHKLRNSGKKIFFARDAIVHWKPRDTFKEAYTMFRRFAYGDMESGIVRNKVLLIFARYLFFAYLLFYSLLTRSKIALIIPVLYLLLYVLYSVRKNIRYVKDWRAWYLLPSLQIVSDIAVLHGSIRGLISRLRRQSKRWSVKDNLPVLIVLGIYLLLVLPLVRWGIPNPSHPFFYQMDEWHSMQSIRYLFSTGSSNVEGAAYGLLFFFFISGLFLIPFTLVGYLNPFAIKSTVTNLAMQERIASILRISTVLWGVGSIVILARIVRSYIKGNLWVALFLFTINPIWLTLGTYFKYDVAVVFWILFTLSAFFSYSEKPTLRNLLIASALSAFAITVKISALPLFGMLLLAFLLFTPQPFKKIKLLVVSLCVFGFVILAFGAPDISKHFMDYYNLLHLNLVTEVGASASYNISGDTRTYLAFTQYPAIFGSFFYFLSAISCLGLLIVTGVTYIKEHVLLKKEILVLSGTFFFILSLLTLRELGAGGNRALVLLPFMILIISLFYKHIRKRLHGQARLVVILIFILGIALQAIQSFAWMSLKYQVDPRMSSSAWMIKNIPSHSILGIENIPIYQMLPDVVVKEFYTPGVLHLFNYQVVDSQSKKLPNLVVVSGDDTERQAFKKSPKIELLNRLKKENYHILKRFSVNYYIFDRLENKREFVLGNLIPMPTSITIYKR